MSPRTALRPTWRPLRGRGPETAREGLLRRKLDLGLHARAVGRPRRKERGQDVLGVKVVPGRQLGGRAAQLSPGRQGPDSQEALEVSPACRLPASLWALHPDCRGRI